VTAIIPGCIETLTNVVKGADYITSHHAGPNAHAPGDLIDFQVVYPMEQEGLPALRR
jgi:hypothetical protein